MASTTLSSRYVVALPRAQVVQSLSREFLGVRQELSVSGVSSSTKLSAAGLIQRGSLLVQAKAKIKEEGKEEKKKEKKEKKEREKAEKVMVMEKEEDSSSSDEEEEKSVNGKAGKKASKEEKKAAKKTEKHAKKREALHFVKYQGLGNDFLLVDNRDSPETKVTPEQAIKLCNRNFGIGADGVIFALPGTDDATYTMRIYNSDGSEPEMCGNGIRCMARFVAELEGIQAPTSYKVQTAAGMMVLNLREDGQVAVDMGPPTLAAAEVPTALPPTNEQHGAVVAAPLEVAGHTWKVTCVSMGNPHCVTFAHDGAESLDVAALDLARIGPLFEHHVAFPARTNTEFVEVLSPTELKMRVWERGAGPTLACGTGACALVVAAVLEGRAERKCTVHLPGGPLEIDWRAEDNHVYMTGPAEIVFEGKAYL